MDAVVTGVESFGLFVQGLELPAEGLVHAESLTDDYYRYDRAAHSLVGHRSGNTFRLGDMVRVAVSRVDLQRRELDFRLAATQGGKRRGGRRPGGRTSSPKSPRPRQNAPKDRGRRREKTTRRGRRKGKRGR
jgi:ribonuclease R